MQRLFRQLMLATVGTFALAGASVALAASTPQATTTPASSVHAVDAQLNGVINTAGYKTRYLFQYGKTITYTTATVSNTIPAGMKQAVSVKGVVHKLSPSTTYHFRLVIYSTIPGKSGVTKTVGKDLTLRTKPTGRLVLDRTIVPVKGKDATITFTCASSIDCTTRVNVTYKTKVAGKPATINCIASKFFTIAAHKKVGEVETVKPACLSLLTTAKKHRLVTKLSANPRTGQHAVIKDVILELK